MRSLHLLLSLLALAGALLLPGRAASQGEPSLAEQIAAQSRALEQAEPGGDAKQIGRILLTRGGLFYRQRQYPQAEADFNRAAALLKGDPAGYGAARFNLGMVYVLQDRFREALVELEAAGVAHEASGEGARLAQDHYWIGFSRHSLLDHAGALSAYRKSAALYHEVQDGRGEARSLEKAGDVLKVLHRDAEALQAWEPAADLYRDNGLPRQEAELLYHIALTYGVMADYFHQYSAQHRRLKVATTLKDPRLIADSMADLASTLGAIGKSQEALEFLGLELTLRRGLKDGVGEARALRDIGEANRDLYRFPEAVENLQKSLETGRAVNDPEQVARTLFALCRLRGDLGEFRLASEAAEEAQRLFRELKLTSHVAETVRELGKQYRAQGRHVEALAQFDASLGMDIEASDLLGAARDLDEMSQDHLLTGRFQEALKLYGKALDVYRAAESKLGEADIHNKLGATLQKLGRYTEAEAEYRKSGELSDELKILVGREQADANLAGLYATIGRYGEAITGYEAALSAFRTRKARASEAIALANLGKVYSSEGDLSKALESRRAALAIYEELNDARGAAQEIYGIALIDSDRARYAEALASLTRALEVFRTAGLRLDEANALSTQSGVYRQLGKIDEAMTASEASRRIRTEIGDRPGLARAESSLAAIYQQTGRYGDARLAYEHSLTELRAIGERPGELTVLNNLGLVLRALGRNKDAREQLEAALKLARSLGDRGAEAHALGNLAFLQQAEGDLGGAEARYREVLAVAGEGERPDVAFRAHFGLSLVQRSRKQWREAARELATATGLIDRIRGGVRERTLQTSFLEQYVSPYVLQADTLLAAGEPAAAYLAGERAKARGLVDALREGKVSVAKAMSPTDRQTEAKLDGRLAALSTELREARFLPTDQLLARESELTATRTELEQFQRELFLAHPTLRAQRGEFAPPTLTQLNRTLFAREPKLCLFSYLVGYQETLLFAITGGAQPTGPAQLHVYRLPITKADLEARVQEFWGECSQPGGRYQGPGARLYRDLIQPAAADLAGKTHLVLVPDGPLHTLPFQALQDSSGKHLIERTSLSYAPSVSALLAMVELGDRRRKPVADELPLLAFGRPQVDAGLSDLPATEREVRTIGRLFGAGAEVVTGAEASEERFKTTAARARCLHLATHGLLNEKAPFYSALALAHGAAEDGRLEARELLELDLHADLVVLSACETALGKTVRGEGVLGLPWSLFVAGTPSTVVSHWQVEDETTGMLMASFYRGMLPAAKTPALPKGQALRAAQLSLLRDKKHAHPYYWAPAVLIGDWRGGVRK